ncbi:MAG: glycosyltransferase family 4 protein [Thermoplasmata archaeon]|nr:glycosyltransferase family 4 protein [Thermoplasmata archaeon]
MKIAQVTLRFDAPGGVETVVRELAGRLRSRGEEVEVFASDLYDEAHWVRRSDFPPVVDGVPVHRYPVYKQLVVGVTMPLVVGLMTGLRAFRPDVIHAHSHRYGHVLESAAEARRLEVPWVVTAHYHPARRDQSALKRGLLRIQDYLFGATAYRTADAIIAITEQERRLLAEFVPSKRIRVIPHGIDLAEWRVPEPSQGSPPGLPALPPRYLLYTGRIAKNKGLGFLLDAVARTPASERIPLVLMGRDWGMRPELERRAQRLGIERDLVWLGHIEDPADYRRVFRRATVFALPSEWEAFGLVLLEAMVAGVPIVATAVGGVPEVLEEGRAGRLVPYGDAPALASAIRDLLGSPEAAAALAAAGRQRVEQYSWGRVIDDHLALYRELAG